MILSQGGFLLVMNKNQCIGHKGKWSQWKIRHFDNLKVLEMGPGLVKVIFTKPFQLLFRLFLSRQLGRFQLRIDTGERSVNGGSCFMSLVINVSLGLWFVSGIT